MATKGSYGITRAKYSTKCLTCLECFRHWVNDITPSGRCPWEHLHEKDQQTHTLLRKSKAIAAGMKI